jgi:hypothetical protein
MNRVLTVLILLPLTVSGCFFGGSKRARVVTPRAKPNPIRFSMKESQGPGKGSL